MIFQIERRTISGNGSIESHWELISYERRTAIGVLVGSKKLYKNTSKIKVEEYALRKGIVVEEE